MLDGYRKLYTLNKKEDIYVNIAKDLETSFDASVFDEYHRPLPKGNNKKVIGLIKDELGGKLRTKFTALPKSYNCLIDNCYENKKGKDTKSCFIKRKLKFEEYKHCLGATQLEN